MLDQNLSLKDDTAHLDSSEQVEEQISIDEHQIPRLEDYHIREDDGEITSSDEQDEEHHDSSFRSWFSRSRHHKSTTASLSPVKLGEFSSSECAIAEGTPSRSGSGSSFRKGFRSFFRRDSNTEGEDVRVDNEDILPETPKDDRGGVDELSEKETEEGNEVVPETPTNSRFWRSWRSGNHHYHRHHRHSKEVYESSHAIEEANVETLRNPSLDVESMISHEEKRQKNMIKLAGQLEDVSANHSPEQDGYNLNDTSAPEKGSSDVESSQSDTTSSSVERALNVKERVGLVFSASPAESGERKCDEISPLTPPADVLENPYKYVFHQKDVRTVDVASDSTFVKRDSVVFKNFDITLKLLTRNMKTLSTDYAHSSVTLSEISNELLEFARHEMECRDRSIKEKELLSSELIVLQNEIEMLRNESAGKDTKISELQKTLDDATGEMEKFNNDLEEAAEEIGTLTKEVEDYKSKIQEAKVHETAAIEELKNKISMLEEEKKSESKACTEISQENTALKQKMEQLQNEHKNLIFDHEILQEKHSITTTRMADLVGNFSKGRVQERDMRESLDATGNKLRRYENTIEILKVGNLKIQDNFRRERRKLLDSREEINYLKRQMQFIECHKNQSLQFMSHLMFYYRGIVTDETLTECDHYLKKLNESDFPSNFVQLKGDELGVYFKERESLVVKFYNDVAKKSFLDQIVSKHVSYMRSNKFLSSQLAGLRKHIDEYEQYVNRLLKEIQTRKNTEEKNKRKIASLQEKAIEYKSKLAQIAK